MNITAIDFETHLIANGAMYPPIVCMSVADEDGRYLHVGSEIESVLHDLLDTVYGADWKVVAHNAKFDFGCILARYPDLRDLVWHAYEIGNIGCTYVREKLLDIQRGQHFMAKGRYSLETLTERWLGETLDKGADSWRLRYAELDGVPLCDWPQEAIDYPIADAVSCRQLYLHQDMRAEEAGYPLVDEPRQVRADLALGLISAWGIRTDLPAVEKLDTEITKLMKDAWKRVEAAQLTNGKGGKSMAAIRATVQATWAGEGEIPLTEKGAISTARETLEQCNSKDLDAIVEYSALQKTQSAYVRHMKTSRPVQAYFNVLVNTGRTSCSRPNLQNQPARIAGVRECFVPRPGHVFLACDYDSQEMRTWAQACVDITGGSVLAERYRADPDFDPHREFAAALYGMFPGEVTKAQRQTAKPANFGFPGGLGARTFVKYARGYNVTIDLNRAWEIKNAWAAQWPESVDYFAHVANLVGDGNAGMLTQLRSGRVRGLVKYTEAANSYFQGLAADVTKSALWNTTRACHAPESKLYGARVVNFVHDELILEINEERAHDGAIELKAIMEHAQAQWTPDVPARASATLMRRWSKKAEPVYVDGRLVPWEG